MSAQGGSQGKLRRGAGVALTALLFFVIAFLLLAPEARAAVSISLNPTAATNIVGTNHVPTATVTDGTTPVPNATVYFFYTSTYYGGPFGLGCAETGGNIFGVTGANGQASCTYSRSVASTDTLTAYVDTNNNAIQDPAEPTATATKRWVSEPIANLVVTPEVSTNVINSEQCVNVFATDASGRPSGERTVGFGVVGANPQATTRTTDASGGAQFCYTGALAGTDTITVFGDNNDNGALDSGEPSEQVSKLWLGSQPTLTLTPPSATNIVGTNHVPTATVTDGTTPVPNATVYFFYTSTYYGGPFGLGCAETGGNIFGVTGANGQASCTYSRSVASTDTLTAYVDTNNNAIQDPAEPTATATKRWVSEPSPTSW